METIEKTNVIIPEFSFFKAPITNTKPTKTVNLLEIYDVIKSINYRERTEKLRAISDVKQAQQYKAANFDYCTFSGIFTSRKDKALVKHSGFLCVDFDHLNNAETLFIHLLNDTHFNTQLLFRSPSGNGLKWIISIDIANAPHGDYFAAVANYILQTYGIEIDKSGRDISRACFLPYDPQAFIKPNLFEKEMSKKEFIPNDWTNSNISTRKSNTPIAGTNSLVYNNLKNDIEIVTTRIEAAGIDIAPNYVKWRDLGFALADALGENGRTYYHRLSCFYPSYLESETNEQFDKCLNTHRDGITISTLYYLEKEAIKHRDIEQFAIQSEIKNNSDVLDILLSDVQSINFQEIVYPEIAKLKQRLNSNKTDNEEKQKIISDINRYKVTDRQKYVVIIEELLRLANERQWGICKNASLVYLFNGSFWSELDNEILQKFLMDCAERMIPKYNARQYKTHEHLFKQFLVTGFKVMPESSNKILINLKNGTFEIDEHGKGTLRPMDKADFLKYQLPFEYNPNAECPIFQKYLDVSLPDKSSQYVLSEYIGYVFARHLKLEKVLFLYGGGANGKSVFFEIVSALLGTQNVSTISIDSICEQNGYFRAMIANKLVNYSSEIGKHFESDKFKQLCSGEPMEVRLPYGKPFQIRNYARLIFNANQLPKDTEQTHAYFRRFLIIPFTVTIPPEQQDIELPNKIINNELSGVFNWVLSGLDRIIKQKGFSKCEASEKILEQYRNESDSVEMFLEENEYVKSKFQNKLLKDLYFQYQNYCNDAGNRACSQITFSKRLKDKGFEMRKISKGQIVYIESNNENDMEFLE